MKTNTIALNPKLSHLYPLKPVTDWEQVLTDWLSTKRSLHTQRAYRKDITNFLKDTGVNLGQFLSFDRFQAFERVNRYKGGMISVGLSSATINRRLSAIKSLVGIKKVMSPHRIRHSAITTALDLSDGNVRAVQKLSRHKNLNTLMIYDDNRKNLQGEITNLLDSVLIES